MSRCLWFHDENSTISHHMPACRGREISGDADAHQRKYIYIRIFARKHNKNIAYAGV